MSQTRTLRNDKQWLQSCYCCQPTRTLSIGKHCLRSCYCSHKLGHWGMTSSGHCLSFLSVTSLDAAEWQAVTTIVLLLSQTRTLRNDKQWLRSCYFCHRCHKLGHWGMTSSGHDRVAFVTGVTKSDIEEWQAVTKIVATVVTGVTNSDTGEWQAVTTVVVTVVTRCGASACQCQAVATIMLLLSPVSQTRTLRNDKQWLWS